MSKDEIKPGEQLTLAQINRIRKQAQAGQPKPSNAQAEGQAEAKKPMTIPQIKDALAAKGIEIPEGVTKRDDLKALLDAAGEQDTEKGE